MPAATVIRLVPLVLVAFLAWLPAALAFAVEATINVDVLGGKWKGVRLKSLPRGASVALRIESSDALRVIVVDSSELRRFPNTRPLFEASMEKRLGFSVVIPRSGDYYVIFDNRKSTEPRQVRLNVKADTSPRTQPPAGKPKKRDETRLDFPSRRHALSIAGARIGQQIA